MKILVIHALVRWTSRIRQRVTDEGVKILVNSCISKMDRVSRVMERVPEFTSERDEGVKILVNSCISKMDRIRMRKSRKTCVAGPRKGGRDIDRKLM